MKILAVGAHQDDNEFGCGGLAARMVAAGHEVRFLSLCNGCGGHHIMTPEETTARRGRESAAVAKYLGITYDVWDIDDCTIMPDLPTRMRLIRYIRTYNPDVIIAHRTNDYHADHRAAAQLVQDAVYILTVPHTCPDVPAMREMPIILYYEDRFKYPPFNPTYVISIDEVIERKLYACHLNESQVYEWLPYTYLQTVPEGEEARFAWLKGEDPAGMSDDEILAHSREDGYAIRFAQTAARFRAELLARYGEEKGAAVRYAEAFELGEYGRQPNEAEQAFLASL